MTGTAVARELSAMLSQRSDRLGDPEVGWAPVLDLAAEHQLLPGLWSAIHRRGVPSLPPALARSRKSPLALIEARHRENADRVDDLRAQLDRVLDALEIAGIDAIALKGGHWLLAGLLTDPAARVMVDLDVLVPRSLGAEAVETLVRIGYEPGPVPHDQEPTDHQLDPLFRAGRPGSVELHVAPVVERRRRLIDADTIRDAAETVIVDHMTRRLPDPTSAMILLIGHAQVQEDGARLLRLPLRALHDLHELPAGYRDGVDWDEVSRRFARSGPGGRTALAGFAVAADHYFDVEVPVPTVGGHAWLRSVETALDHPAAARRYRDLAYLPFALRAERMGRLHGADHGARLWGARLAHVASGAGRRLRRGP